MSNSVESEKPRFGLTKPPRRDRRTPAVILLCLLAANASTEVRAAQRGRETSEIQLRYSYRELISATAARRLLTRIGNAALESCGASTFSLVEFKAATETSQCWRDAVDDAVRRIGSPALSAVASEARR
jgi:UrcA family protein